MLSKAEDRPGSAGRRALRSAGVPGVALAQCSLLSSKCLMPQNLVQGCRSPSQGLVGSNSVDERRTNYTKQFMPSSIF